MAFTAEQIKAVEITERVGSGISLLCSSSIIATFFLTDHFQTPIHRLIFFASWGNMWSNIAMMIALSGIQRGENSALCQFQGLLIQWFTPADPFWSLCMAWDIFLACSRRYDTKMLRRLEWKYFLLCYGMAFIPAFVFLFIETNARGKIYGSAYVWCWVTVDWRALYLAIYYIPVWIANILTIGIYVWTGGEILKSRNELRRARFDARGPRRHSVGISGSSGHQLMSSQATDSDLTHQSMAIPETYSESQEGSYSPVQNAVHTQNVVWPYAKRAMLYFTAMLITWTPCTVNRLYSFVHPHNPLFVLNYLQALFLPLQGFWMACIYMSTFPFQCRWNLCWKHSSRSDSV